MGNKSSKTSIQPFLLKYKNEFSYVRSMNKNYIYNTILAEVEDEGLIVWKLMFSKSRIEANALYESISVEIEKMQEAFHIHSCPNILPYNWCNIKANSWIMIMRQYMHENLRNKINQKWEIIEKKWLTFQLLNAVSQLHSKAITHGDIKPENILLTSYNWLFLSDFLTVEEVYDVSAKDDKERRMINYKPTYVKQDVWTIYNMFFGDFDNNKRCYIAPERCLDNSNFLQKTTQSYMVQPSMDVFSVGCVIAEIFLDGKPLFDLARHQLYWKGLFNPKDILWMIDDEEIESLIMSMISVDPQNRKSIDAYRLDWINRIFPFSFKSIMFQLGSWMLRENIIFSDERIAMIRKYFDAVWISCFGEEIGATDLLVPTNPLIFEYLKFQNFPNIISDLFPDYDCIISHKNNGERLIQKLEFTTEREKENASDSTLVLINMIGTFLMTCRFPDSKVIALEMLKSLGKQIRTEFRLQYVVPYCISCFTDEEWKVRISAIDSVIEVLEDWESINIGHTDYYVFNTYLFPAFYKLLDDEEVVVRLKFIEKLPYLVNIGKMLIASVNIHKQNIALFVQDDQNENEISPEERENLLFEFFNESQVPLDSADESTKHQEESFKDFDQDESMQNDMQERQNLNKVDYMEGLFEENNIVSWSRKRFVTDEQKVRSVVGIGYNISLNDHESDISEDPEQEDEVNREIEELRNKILDVVERILHEHDLDIYKQVLLENLEDLAEFFGEANNTEKLLPYILSFVNHKNDMLTITTLKALRVLSHNVNGVNEIIYIVNSWENIFYRTNEIILLEALKTITYIAKHHQNVFEK